VYGDDEKTYQLQKPPCLIRRMAFLSLCPYGGMTRIPRSRI